MVLSAPPSDDAPRKAEAWLARIERLLALGQGRRVLILLRSAGPEHLGPLARRLWRSEPSMRVCLHVRELEASPSGALVLLPVESQDLVALNLNRTLFAERHLRVVLLANAPTAEAMGLKAPDFFHWISHVVEAPRRLADHLVASLRLLRESPGVSVEETDLSTLLSEGFPRASVKPVPPCPYAQLVEAMMGDAEWVVAPDAELDAFQLRLAMAEARRSGGVLARVPVPGWPRLERAMEDLAEARRARRMLGEHAGNILAAVDAEPAAVEIAARLLAEGEPPEPLVDRLRAASDGGAMLGHRLFDRDEALIEEAARWTAPAPFLRAARDRSEVTRRRRRLVEEARIAVETSQPVKGRPNCPRPGRAN